MDPQNEAQAQRLDEATGLAPLESLESSFAPGSKHKAEALSIEWNCVTLYYCFATKLFFTENFFFAVKRVIPKC